MNGSQQRPVPQSRVHEPQLLSLQRLRSQPLLSLPSQLPHCPMQFEIRQLPALQSPLAWLKLQALLHAPQCPTLMFVFTSQPFDVTPSQFA